MQDNRQEKENIFELLFKPQQPHNYMPNQLLQRKEKKKETIKGDEPVIF